MKVGRIFDISMHHRFQASVSLDLKIRRTSVCTVPFMLLLVTPWKVMGRIVWTD